VVKTSQRHGWGGGVAYERRTISGSLAMLAAMRRASSLLIRCAAKFTARTALSASHFLRH